jgi:hypothetical protein
MSATTWRGDDGGTPRGRREATKQRPKKADSGGEVLSAERSEVG